MKNIFRNMGWLLGSRGINAALSLVYLAFASRTLGLAQFGQFAMILVLAQGIAGIASFNTWQTIVKWGHARGDGSETAGFAIALDLLSIAGGLGLAAVAALSAPLWLPVPGDSEGLIFALSAAALFGLRSTPTGILRLNDRYDLSALAEAALPVTRAIGATLAVLFAPTIAGFVAAWAAAELVCGGAYWLLASRFLTLRLKDISLFAFPGRTQGIWPFVFSTSLSRTVAVLAKQLLLLAVGAIGGAVLAGGYRAASQLGQALAQLGEAVSRAIYPDFVKREARSADIAHKMVLIAALAGMASAILAVLFGRLAIDWIVGREFLFAYPALVLLSLAGAIDLTGASWDALLVSRKQAGRALAMRIVPLAAALCAMPWAMSRWGLTGVAGCVLAASAATLAGLGHSVRSRTEGASAPRPAHRLPKA